MFLCWSFVFYSYLFLACASMCVYICVFAFYSVARDGIRREDLKKKIFLEHHFLLMIMLLHQRRRRRCPFTSCFRASSLFEINLDNKILSFPIEKRQKIRKNQRQCLVDVRQKHPKDQPKKKIVKGKFFSFFIFV